MGTVNRIEIEYSGHDIVSVRRCLEASRWWLNKAPFDLRRLRLAVEVTDFRGLFVDMLEWTPQKLTVTTNRSDTVVVDVETLPFSLAHLEDVSFVGPTRSNCGFEPSTSAFFRNYSLQFLQGATAVPMPLSLHHIEKLQQCINLRSVNLTRTDIADISWLPWDKLEFLNVRECHWLTSIEMVRKAKGLRGFCGGQSNRQFTVEQLLDCSRLQVLDVSAWETLRDCASFASLPSLTELQLANTAVSDLSPLVHCTQLRHLTLCRCTSVADLAPLSALRHLSFLNVNYTAVSSLSQVAKCPTLSQLSASGTRILSVAPLATVKTLASLTVMSTAIASVDGLAQCPLLTDVNVAYCDQLTSLSGLVGAQSLQSVNAHGSGLRSLGTLDRCPHLAQLNVSNCANLRDLSPINQAPRLHELLAWGTDIRTVEGLKSCPHLTTLDVSGCKKLHSLSALAGAPRLSTLHAVDSGVRELAGLRRCPNLTELDVYQCRALTDLSPLAGSPSLTWLCATDSGVRKVFATGACPKLQELQLTNTPFANKGKQSVVRSCPSCENSRKCASF